MLSCMEAPDSTPAEVVPDSTAARQEALSESDVVLDESASAAPRADATEELSPDAILEVANALGDDPPPCAAAPVEPSALAKAWRRARPFAPLFVSAALLGLALFGGPLTLRLHPRHALGSSTRADVVAVRGLHEAPAPAPVAPAASATTDMPPRRPLAVAMPVRVAAVPHAPKPAPKSAAHHAAAAKPAPPKTVVSTVAAAPPPAPARTNAPSALLRSTRDRHVYF